MTKLRDQDAEKRRARGGGPDYSEALARGLQIVSVFSRSLGPMSLADIAREVDLPKATARRALHTLVHLGYVEADGRLFRVTPRILRLAHAYLCSNMVSTVLQPACEQLTRETHQSCSAAVLDGSEIVMIARATPAQSIAIGAGIGFRLPALSSSLGSVLLSSLPPTAIDGVLEKNTLADTPFTVRDPQTLRAILQEVRNQGYAYVDQEAESGFRSVAVPVRKFDGSVVAALHLGGRTSLMSEHSITERYLPLLRQVAADLQHQML